MKIGKKIKQYNYESILVSILIILLGIIMIIFSNNILNIISYLIGIALIIIGLYKIFDYIKFKGKYNIYNYDLSYGIFNIILGILCLIFKEEIQSIFRIIIGVIIIYEGIISISLAHKVCYVNKNFGMFSILLSILMILCGVIIVMTKGILVATIGYILIIFSLMDIVESLIFNRNVKKIEKYFNEIEND